MFDHSTGIDLSKFMTSPACRCNRSLSATFRSIRLCVAPVSKMNLKPFRFPICPSTTTRKPETRSKGIVELSVGLLES